MGRPASPTLRPGDDAVSLHTQPGDRLLLDDDAPELGDEDLPGDFPGDDDLPPLYDEVADNSRSLLIPPSSATTIAAFKKDDNTGIEYFLDSRLDTDPKFLEDHLKVWATSPPRPYVQLVGTHNESTHKKGKTEKKTVTDFDVRVELTPYLYSDAVHGTCWRELRPVENDKKVRRGTILRKKAPGTTQGVQLGPHTPSLAEWCHRYCAQHAGLKRFTLKREMVGFDADRLKEKLEGLIRSTNYHGHVSIKFPVRDEYVEVYNECKTNQWRLTNWIFWLVALTATFIFTWPYLFFRTKRFEVAVAEWRFSKPGTDGRRQYVSISEDQWYNMWGRALNRAVLERRQGVLDQQDLLAAEGAGEISLGNAAADTAIAIVRAGVGAMNEVNRQFGWGYDS